MTKYVEALKSMDERFGHDTLICVATIEGVLFRHGTRILIIGEHEAGKRYEVSGCLL